MLRSLRLPGALAALVMLIVAIVHAAGAGAVAPANPAFQKTWERTDQPIVNGNTSRTWIWGPQAISDAVDEPYAEAPGGKRQVQYYDKSRMEINDPNHDPNDPFFVTNGLLVVELMTGQLQLGDFTFEQHEPARVNVAGDPDDVIGPTYATMAMLRPYPPAVDSQLLTQRVDRNGTITNDPSLASYGITAAYRATVPGIDHQIASPFWTFMTSNGVIYENGAYTTAALFPNPFYATGYPLTEAYWARVKVAGLYRDVLMQCFERRCLTYTPGNSPGFETEAGNVGLHYNVWRYEQIPSEVTPTATSTATSTATNTPIATNTPTATATFTPTATTSVTATATETLTPSPTVTTTVPPVTNYAFSIKWGALHDATTTMDSPVAVAVDAANNVFVLDTTLNRVQKYTNLGVFVAQWGSAGSGDGQFNAPSGIAVDSGGNVWVADTGNNRLQKFDNSGIYLTQVGSTGHGQLQFESPISIAINASDVIHVGEMGGPDPARIQLLTTGLAYVSEWTDAGVYADALLEPRGIAFDTAGNAYVSDKGLASILVYDTSGVVQQSTQGNVANFQPWGIAVDAAGHLLVVNSFNNVIQVRSAEQLTSITSFGSSGTDPGQFESAAGLVVDHQGLVYIADRGAGKVVKYRPDGVFQFEWSDDLRGRFSSPRGAGFDSGGYLWIADSGNNRIVRYTPGGVYQSAFGTAGSLSGQFNNPLDVVIDSTSDMVVLDSGNNRIQKFDLVGHTLPGWGSAGAGAGQFNAASALALDGSNNVYVADTGNHRVQKFGDDGTFITQWQLSAGASGSPGGIEVVGNEVFVVDTGNNRVEVFDLDGNPLRQWGSAGAANGAFAAPSAIVADEDGYLYVADTNNNRVQKFDANGVFIVAIGTSGSADGQFNHPQGLAIDTDGNLYVIDTGNHRIQRFTPA